MSGVFTQSSESVTCVPDLLLHLILISNPFAYAIFSDAPELDPACVFEVENSQSLPDLPIPGLFF